MHMPDDDRANEYPVIALKGAPARFPVLRQDRSNEKYMIWSDAITEQVESYLNKTFRNEKFVGIDLRNGIDWSNACDLTKDGMSEFMASTQCLESTNMQVTRQLCFPDRSVILNDLHDILVVKLKRSVSEHQCSNRQGSNACRHNREIQGLNTESKRCTQ